MPDYTGGDGLRGMGEWRKRHTKYFEFSLVLNDDCMIRGVDGPLLMNHLGKAISTYFVYSRIVHERCSAASVANTR